MPLGDNLSENELYPVPRIGFYLILHGLHFRVFQEHIRITLNLLYLMALAHKMGISYDQLSPPFGIPFSQMSSLG
jgi:hypothetical protein